MSVTDTLYYHDPVFNERKKKWDAARLAEQREIARIMGLPEPSAVLTPRESERLFGKGPSRKTAPSAVIPIKPPVSNPYKRLASREHRQRQALLDISRKSQAPTPAPEQPKNKSVRIGNLVFAGSVAETIEGAGR